MEAFTDDEIGCLFRAEINFAKAECPVESVQNGSSTELMPLYHVLNQDYQIIDTIPVRDGQSLMFVGKQFIAYKSQADVTRIAPVFLYKENLVAIQQIFRHDRDYLYTYLRKL